MFLIPRKPSDSRRRLMPLAHERHRLFRSDHVGGRMIPYWPKAKDARERLPRNILGEVDFDQYTTLLQTAQ
jgi:hypothetical protein